MNNKPRMNPDVVDALFFALWHHQGASSPVGQPLRKILGLGEYERMTSEQCDAARRIQSAIEGAKSPAAKTADWRMMEEPAQQELDRIRGANPGDVVIDEVGAKLQSKLDAVTTWSAADWAEVLSYADEKTLAKLPNFLACPFPCGWQTLHKIAVQDAAFLAKFNWPEDEEGVSVPKAVAMRSMDNLIQICRAMLSQSASQKEASASAEPVALPDEVLVLLNHIEDVMPDSSWDLIDAGLWNAVTRLAAPVAALTQQDADKVDAERYRFIRDGERDVWCSTGDWPLSGDELDAAIDAARQEKKE